MRYERPERKDPRGEGRDIPDWAGQA